MGCVDNASGTELEQLSLLALPATAGPPACLAGSERAREPDLHSLPESRPTRCTTQYNVILKGTIDTPLCVYVCCAIGTRDFVFTFIMSIQLTVLGDCWLGCKNQTKQKRGVGVLLT